MDGRKLEPYLEKLWIFVKGRIKYIYFLFIGILSVLIRSAPFGLSYKLNLLFLLKKISLIETLGIIKVPGWKILSFRVIPLFFLKILDILFGQIYSVFYLYQGIILGLFGIIIYVFLGEFTGLSNNEKIIISTISIITPGVLASAWVGALEILGSIFIFSGLIFHKKLLKRRNLDKNSLILIFLFTVSIFFATISGETVLAFSFIILFSYSIYILQKRDLEKFQSIPILISFGVIFVVTGFFLSYVMKIFPRLANMNIGLILQRTPGQIKALILNQPPQFLFSIGFGGSLILFAYSILLLNFKNKKTVPLLSFFIIVVFFIAGKISLASTSLVNEIVLSGKYAVPILSFLFLFSLSIILLKTEDIERFFSLTILFSIFTIISMAIYMNPRGGQGVGPRHYSIVMPFLISLIFISFKKLKAKLDDIEGIWNLSLKVIIIFSLISLVCHLTFSTITFSQKVRTNSIIHRGVKEELATQKLKNASIFYQLPGVHSDFRTNFAYLSDKKIEDVPRLNKWEDRNCKKLESKNYLYRINTLRYDNNGIPRNIISDDKFNMKLDGLDIIYNKKIGYTYIHPWIINYPKMIFTGDQVVSTYSQLGQIYSFRKEEMCQ